MPPLFLIARQCRRRLGSVTQINTNFLKRPWPHRGSGEISHHFVGAFEGVLQLVHFFHDGFEMPKCFAGMPIETDGHVRNHRIDGSVHHGQGSDARKQEPPVKSVAISANVGWRGRGKETGKPRRPFSRFVPAPHPPALPSKNHLKQPAHASASRDRPGDLRAEQVGLKSWMTPTASL